MKLRIQHLLLSGCLALVLAHDSLAAEPFQAFLDGLRQRGFGEQALAYLDQISTRKDLPVELRKALDLERSKSLRVAAAEAYDLQQRTQRLEEADQLLEKFLKEYPDHPAGAPALIGQADEILNKAQLSLGLSRATRDKTEQAEHCKRAREQFAAAAEQLKLIHAKISAQLEKMGPVPPNGKPTAARLDYEFAILETRFKLALVEYSTALTYIDEKDPARKKILQQAGKSFDSVFQLNRGTRAGFLAHMWHGKVLEELGDDASALEYFDEVLVITPDRNAPIEDANLFGQAQLFRLQLLGKTAKAEMEKEAEEWLKLNRTWEKTSPYQGILMELVKVRIDAAQKATGVDQRKKLQSAISFLQMMAKVDSEYKQEALLLRRECQEKLGTDAGTITAEEELALGDAAVASKEWADATACYERSLALATSKKDQKTIDAAKQRLMQVRYQLAIQLFSEKKHDEAIKAASALVREAGNDPVAISASGLAIASALELYSTSSAEAKPAVLDRLQRIANYTIEHWPDRAEADDGRMAIARALLLKHDEDGALALLSQVNPRSKRYGTSQQVAGQLYWKRYLTLKKSAAATAPVAADASPEAIQAAAELKQQNEAQLQTLRGQARKAFRESLLSLKEIAAEDKDRADPATIFDTQLLLAESCFEDHAAAEAAPLFDELITQIKAKESEEIDNNTLRSFIGGVRSRLATGDVSAAGDSALALVDRSGDSAQVNGVLIDFAKLISLEVKKADAEVIRVKVVAPLNHDSHQPAIAAADATRKVLSQLVTKLSERKEVAIAGLVFLGDTSALVNQHAQARDIYQRVLQRIEKPSPEDDVAAYAKAGTRIRSQLISILRNEGKFEEANKQVDALIAAHPNSLEPKLEKGRILQSWAEKDPARYDECVTHWANIRVLLGRIKNRPPEYYEVLYNCAFCLLQQSVATKDPTKALEAGKILKSTMTLSPNLSGPDMVESYKALLTKTATAAKQPAATATKHPPVSTQPAKVVKATDSKSVPVVNKGTSTAPAGKSKPKTETQSTSKSTPKR